MAKRHSDDAQRKEESIERENEKDSTNGHDDDVSASRRSVLQGAAAAATTLGVVGVFSSGAAASSGLPIQPDGKAVVEPGEYTWENGYVEIGPDAALVGGGDTGDVVLNLGTTMAGEVKGRLENIVLRGDNPNPVSSIDPYPGATIDGFIWPEGGQQNRDRAFFTPDGGDERVMIRNSAWAFCVNNGAYCDKPAMTFENCAAVNNNISGIRLGHRRGTPSDMTSYVRNSLVAVTADIPNDDVNVSNGRGVRLRFPGNFVIENCHFIYCDVHGATSPIMFHDKAAGSSVTIRNCTFYNETDEPLLRDKTGGNVDVTVENCQAVGPGSYEFELGDVSESDLAAAGDVSFPFPSDVTGYAAADEINGVGPGIGPWDDSPYTGQPKRGGDNPAGDGYEHTLVLHASPNNPVSPTAAPGDFDIDITVSGEATFGTYAEPNDSYENIVENADGTTTIQLNDLMPDELDSFRFDGEVLDYQMDDGYEVDVSLDGTTTTLEELVNGQPVESGGGGLTDDGTNTNDGSSSDGSQNDSLPHMIIVDGEGELTQYTFTVSGEVERAPQWSVTASDSMPIDKVQDIARDGKVIGVVGIGVDAYRYSGHLTAFSIDGDANVDIRKNV